MLGVVLRGFRDGSHEICVFFCPRCQWKITSCSLCLGERFSPLQELWFLFSNGEANYFCSCLSLVWPREETLRQLQSYHKSEVQTNEESRWLTLCTCVWVSDCDYNPCQVLSQLGGCWFKAQPFLHSWWPLYEQEREQNCGIQAWAGCFAPSTAPGLRRAQQTLS